MVKIYMVSDAMGNDNEKWYGDMEDMLDCLKEGKGKMTEKELEKFNATPVCDLLEEIGLTMQCIYDKN